jgi:signal transduction histidine kinase
MRFAAFNPESSDTRGTGLGLGLHLVQRIVAVHGGRVWAENRPEGGARVGFELPRAVAA